MNTWAGWELNQRKPRHAPTSVAPKMARSVWSDTKAMPV
jgi:hypothetical protein